MNRHDQATASISAAVGCTPLVALGRLGQDRGLRILVKLESMNPLGSVKDRVALAMIQEAEDSGKINKETVLIEATSGNTGIGLAFLCASRGYKLILTMPESMSLERRQLLSRLGAELMLTPAAEGMSGALAKARQLAAAHTPSWMPSQFSNSANPEAHFRTTGPEIWRQSGGTLDLFVAGVGTGGTISGAGGYLKTKNQALRIIAVEPSASAVLSGQAPGRHSIQGIGAGFVPPLFNRDLVDAISSVSDEAAHATARLLAREEGILCGPSGGAALAAALRLGEQPEHQGKTVAVLLADSGERYLSVAN